MKKTSFPKLFYILYEKFSLLLGKLMVSSKGWREAREFAMPAAQFPDPSPTVTWLQGKQGKH